MLQPNLQKKMSYIDLLVTQPWSKGEIYDGSNSPRMCLCNCILMTISLLICGNTDAGR